MQEQFNTNQISERQPESLFVEEGVDDEIIPLSEEDKKPFGQDGIAWGGHDASPEESAILEDARKNARNLAESGRGIPGIKQPDSLDEAAPSRERLCKS